VLGVSSGLRPAAAGSAETTAGGHSPTVVPSPPRLLITTGAYCRLSAAVAETCAEPVGMAAPRGWQGHTATQFQDVLKRPGRVRTQRIPGRVSTSTKGTVP